MAEGARLSEHGCFGGRVGVLGARLLHEVQEGVQRHGRQQRLVVHHVGRLRPAQIEFGTGLKPLSDCVAGRCKGAVIMPERLPHTHLQDRDRLQCWG